MLSFFFFLRRPAMATLSKYTDQYDASKKDLTVFSPRRILPQVVERREGAVIPD